MKVIKIRLGGQCNQNCSFCHSNKDDDYVFNPKLIPFIKYNHFNKINYGGGEPLVYWDTIKFFMNSFPKLKHHIVTNGSLFNEEMLEYTQKYDLRIGVSLNDYTNIDKHTLSLLSKVEQLGYGIVYTGDKTLDEIDDEVDRMNSILNRNIYPNYNLMHTTCNNTKTYTSKQIQYFIDAVDIRIRSCLDCLKTGKPNKYTLFTFLLVRNLSNKKLPGCNNAKFSCVSLDGRYMSCPYDGSYLQSIDIELTRPRYNFNKCYSCNLKGKCNSCYKNTTDNECYILNRLYDNINQCLVDYHIENIDTLKDRLNLEVT